LKGQPALIAVTNAWFFWYFQGIGVAAGADSAEHYQDHVHLYLDLEVKLPI
jgi:hypothetical protein